MLRENISMNETKLSTNITENTINSTEDILRELQETQELLRKTELRLCEMEIEKVRYYRKYIYYEKKTDYWKDQTRQVKEQIAILVNSRFWKLRSKLLAPINRFRKLSPKNIPSSKTVEKDFIEATQLAELPSDPAWEQRLLSSPRIAIQVHAFYPDLFKDICDGLKNVPFPYDLYVTTTEKYKATYILEYLSKHNTAANYYVDIIENKGRDVIPFLTQIQPVISQYDYICHLHTKRSLHSDIGKMWRNYLYENLIGSTHHIKKIFYEFETNRKLGIVFPDVPEVLKKILGWAKDKQYAEELMNQMNLDCSFLPEDIIFPAGTMFWARTDAVKELFLIDLNTLTIPDELDQLDGTIMHAIERIFPYIAEAKGYTYIMHQNISNIEVTEE